MPRSFHTVQPFTIETLIAEQQWSALQTLNPKKASGRVLTGNPRPSAQNEPAKEPPRSL